jgi:hypothetical protein
MKTAPSLRRAAIAGVAALLTACSSAHIQDSLKDLSETIELVGSISSGVQLQFRVTQVAQAGAGSTVGWKAGLKKGHLDAWYEEVDELGVSLLYMHEVFRAQGSHLIDMRTALYGEPGYNAGFPEYRLYTDRNFFDIGGCFNCVFIGLEAVIRPAEIADWVTGLFGYDLLRDDCYQPSQDDLVARLRSDNARVRLNAADSLRRRTGEDYGYVHCTSGEFTPEERAAAAAWPREKE